MTGARAPGGHHRPPRSSPSKASWTTSPAPARPRAAHDLCYNVPKARRSTCDVKGAGHYGIFSGRRWREKVYPQVRDFILQFNEAASSGRKTTSRKRRGRRPPQPHDGASHHPGARPPQVSPEAARSHAALPQTQCTRCGYPDCAGYARAIAAGEADINQCPPGGAEGIARLAHLTRRPAVPLNPPWASRPAPMAVIDEDWCIGCTLCLEACPDRCDPGRQQAHAHRDRGVLHRLRAVRAGLPGGLHRPGERNRRGTGWTAWSAAPGG